MTDLGSLFGRLVRLLHSQGSIAYEHLRDHHPEENARQVFLRRVEQLAGRRFQTRWEVADWLPKNLPETNPSAPPQGLESP